MTAVPPLIPGSQILSTLSVGTAEVDTLLGNVIYKLNTWKGSVTVATTANISLVFANPFVIDGKTLVKGDTILVKNQTNAVQNGLYEVASNTVGTSFLRLTNLPVGSRAAGLAVFVNEGTLNGDKVFVCTNNYPTDLVGTDLLSFSSLVSGGVVIAGKVDVTQGLNMTTGVTANGPAGTITSINNPILTAGNSAVFPVTNTYFDQTIHRIYLQVRYEGTTGLPYATVSAVGASTFSIRVSNIGATPLDANVLINYLIV